MRGSGRWLGEARGEMDGMNLHCKPLLFTHSLFPYEEAVLASRESGCKVLRQVPWAILRQGVKPLSYYQDSSILSIPACVQPPHTTI